MIRRILVLLLVLVALGVGAYLYFAPNSRVPDAAQTVLAQASDATTTGKVKSAFVLSKRLSAYDINVDTSGGVVTLSGKVPSEIDRELAEGVARDTTGVKQVTNQLIVDPAVQPSEASVRESSRVADLEIQADVREKLAASETLRGQAIQTSVKDRVVTLQGEVETPAQKTGAEQVARAVPNVANVTNNLSVKNPSANQTAVPGIPESEAKDKELARQVSFALFNARENFVNAGDIKAECRDGEVTLIGSVASKAERILAEKIAQDVAGVKSVRNSLTVNTSNKKTI
ncbi:MAG TPA: BON domain-containing protein [Blastocatellia bacterium]|nr:BON domain-containing protein [Blastocatellia bacterium]